MRVVAATSTRKKPPTICETVAAVIAIRLPKPHKSLRSFSGLEGYLLPSKGRIREHGRGAIGRGGAPAEKADEVRDLHPETRTRAVAREQSSIGKPHVGKPHLRVPSSLRTSKRAHAPLAVPLRFAAARAIAVGVRRRILPLRDAVLRWQLSRCSHLSVEPKLQSAAHERVQGWRRPRNGRHQSSDIHARFTRHEGCKDVGGAFCTGGGLANQEKVWHVLDQVQGARLDDGPGGAMMAFWTLYVARQGSASLPFPFLSLVPLPATLPDVLGYVGQPPPSGRSVLCLLDCAPQLLHLR